ncbi:MAG: hypothetical protein GX803_07740 [Lentisphaerae bacterium]|nr:hypothetical protein [Lentisphaerota bacterium]
MSRTGHLEIGPLCFDLRSTAPGALCYDDPAYAGFFAHSTDTGNALARLPVEVVCGFEPCPTRAPLWLAPNHWAIWEDASDWIIHVGLQAPEEQRLSCRVTRDFTAAELWLHPAAWASGDCIKPLRYPLDQILAWGLLAKVGGVLLHASVAVRDGVGQVFTGRSGAGKSTIARLFEANGWRILNDDRVVVFRREGQWRVAGTPWHGSERYAEPDEVPLGNIHFLHQALTDRLEPMPESQIRMALLDVAAVPWFEDSWSQGILDGLNQLAQDVPCHKLFFRRTPDVVALLEGGHPFLREEVLA